MTHGRAGSTVPAEARADDARLAAALAGGAGAVLMDLRAQAGSGRVDVALDGPALGRAGDAAAQAWLAAALAGARPGDAILSEEGERDDRRLTADRVWIIDPLDGTREFAECAPDGTRRTDFAVHVALWTRGHGLIAGAVALPARGRVLDTATVGPGSAPSSAGPVALASGSPSAGPARRPSCGGSRIATTSSSWSEARSA